MSTQQGDAQPVRPVSPKADATAHPLENSRKAPPSREDNRSSYSLSNDNYDLLWKEAKRMNLSMTGAMNVLLEELQQWRAGGRRFTERRKAQR
jgi:hypothetical protein